MDCLAPQTTCHPDGIPLCCAPGACTITEGQPTGICTNHTANKQFPIISTIPTSTSSNQSQPATSTLWYTLGPLLLILLLVATVSIVIWVRLRRLQDENELPQLKLPSLTYITLRRIVNNRKSCVRRFEVPETAFIIDHATTLGSGHFSVVFKAALRGTQVAAKTVSPGLQNQEHLLGLVRELKTLIRVGVHDNVVSLLGANTQRLRQGVCYVFLELCSNGSLDKYIAKVPPHVPAYIPEEALVVLQHAHNWCIGISAGMAHIASRRIIHGDLATRNVLLTTEMSVKIGDFGLSRKLYTYTTNYVQQTEDVPLPWQHMAPEALTHLTFSTQSDVWAFGVTMWQIYSFEEIPYMGINYGHDFVRGLTQRGVRLPKPGRVPEQMYQLMQDCWALEPENRPSFQTLNARLVEMAAQAH